MYVTSFNDVTIERIDERGLIHTSIPTRQTPEDTMRNKCSCEKLREHGRKNLAEEINRLTRRVELEGPF